MSADPGIEHDVNAINPYSVRWYYSATSTVTPGALDIPGKSHLIRFSDGDSLLLETVYRKHATEYNKCWLQQQEKFKRAKLEKSPPSAPEPKQAELEPRGPTVRAGYFEADIRARSVVYDCTSWEDHKLQPEGVHAARVDLSDVSEQNYYALFCERSKIYLCSRDNLAFLKGLWTEAPGAMLIRGYSSAIDAQAPQGKKQDQEEIDLSNFESRTVGMAVRHVVMAVHGIGQRMGGRTIVEDAQAVRSRINAMLDDHMPDEIGRGYIQVLPIQWRKNLDLEADRVADRIMPEGARTFRMLAHNTCVEVLMYMSPSHAQSIVDSVANNLNTSYLKFIRRHPEFNGKFSVLAYSLGSVLCYDLLSHQPMKANSMLARGLDNLMARQALATEGGGWAGVHRGMEGGSVSVTARTTADSAFVQDEIVPDAAVTTATALDSPGAAPNTSRTEGPGPTAPAHDTELSGDGEGKSGEGKSAHSGSSGWAAGLWKAITQSILPGAGDDGDHSADAAHSKEGKETPPTPTVDRVSEILDAAPRRMMEEAAKSKQSAAMLNSNSGTGANTVSQDSFQTQRGGAEDSTPASGATSPAADSPVAEGATRPSLSANRSVNGGSSVGDDEERATGQLLASLAGKEEGGEQGSDGKGAGKEKTKKNGYRWRIPLPRSFRVKRKKSECIDGAGSQQSCETTQETESMAQSGPGELHTADASTADQGVGQSGTKPSVAGDGTAVCESADHSHPGDTNETVGSDEGVLEGFRDPVHELDTAVQPEQVGTGPTVAADDGGAAAIVASESAGNIGVGTPHQNGARQQGAQEQSEDQALHTLPSLAAITDGHEDPAELSPPALADVVRSQGCSAAVGSTVFRPRVDDSTPASARVAGHAVHDSSRLLGGPAAAVTPAQADMVAESATHAHQDVEFQSRKGNGDAVLNTAAHTHNDTHSSAPCAAVHRQAGLSLGLDAKTDCRRSCDSSAQKAVSHISSALNSSVSEAQVPEGSDVPSCQPLARQDPHSGGGACALGGAHRDAEAAAPAVDEPYRNTLTNFVTDTGAHACIDAQQGMHRSRSMELRQLLEQQAQMSNRIEALRAAMRSESTVFESAPQQTAICASDALQNDTRDVRQSMDRGSDAVCTSQSSLPQQAAATVPVLAAEASLQDDSLPDMGRHHTYGMGELMDEDGSVEEADAGAEHGPESPVKSTIELARVLWPGNTLHDLDQQEKVPLSTQAVQYPKLFFEVDNFIMIGSPTGLFCALRGINPCQQTPLGSLAAGRLDPAAAPGCLPVCRRFYNVFHPYDPVAYRMEPLVQAEDIPKPQHVPDHKHGRKLHIGLAETSESVARTMNQWQRGVAHAFTFSFKRSKGGQHERTVAVQNLEQCSLVSSILGAPVPQYPPELLPCVPTLDLAHSGLSLSIPTHPSPLHHSLSQAQSSLGPGTYHDGTNGLSTLERSTEQQAASPVPAALNHGSLPPLAEESSQTTVLTTPAAPDSTSGLSNVQQRPSASAEMASRSDGAETVAAEAFSVPQRPASEHEHRLEGAPAASENDSQHAKSAPKLPAPLRLTMPAASADGMHLHVPSASNPALPASNAGSPVSSTNSATYLRSISCVQQQQQQPAEQGNKLHRRSSLARLQTAAVPSEVPSPPPSSHAAYSSIGYALQHGSPSLVSLPGAGASIDGSSISGFRAGSDALGKAGGDTSSMRLSKSRPVLARAGQFGPVSKGQGGSVGRLDFQLQEDFAELQWVGAFKAHFCYWKHDDVALLICRAACGYDVVDGRKEEQPEEESHTDHEPTSTSS